MTFALIGAPLLAVPAAHGVGSPRKTFHSLFRTLRCEAVLPWTLGAAHLETKRLRRQGHAAPVVVPEGSETDRHLRRTLARVERQSKTATDILRFVAPLLVGGTVELSAPTREHFREALDRWVQRRLLPPTYRRAGERELRDVVHLLRPDSIRGLLSAGTRSALQGRYQVTAYGRSRALPVRGTYRLPLEDEAIGHLTDRLMSRHTHALSTQAWRRRRYFGTGSGAALHAARRLALAMLRRSSNLVLAQVLPTDVAWYPPGDQPELRALVRRASTHRGSRAALAALELFAAQLRGSTDPAEQRRLALLQAYLEQLKRGPWVDRWLQQRLERFAGSDGPGWSLLDRVRFEGQIDDASRRELRARLSAAWSLLRKLAHPDLLKGLPPVTVVVQADRERAAHSGAEIRLSPRSTVPTILHELGHHIEDHGPVQLLSFAYAVRTQRASSTRALKLQELCPDRSYTDDEIALPGAYVDAYVGKTYTCGATEVLSVGLQHFSSLEAAREFFRRDGHHALATLAMLQQRYSF